MELLQQKVDLDKPGFAQHYCIHCAKYFIDEQAIKAHYRTKVCEAPSLIGLRRNLIVFFNKTKVHKRRLKALEIEPYSIEESERAAGHGNFVEAPKRRLETQPTKEELAQGKKLVLEIVEKTEMDDD